MIVKFTNTESEILHHRLEGDTQWEVMDNTYLQTPWTEDEVADKCKDLLGCRPLWFDTEDELSKWLVADAVDGSVFMDREIQADAVALGEITKGKALAYIRASQSIERKLAEAGMEVVFP